MDVLYDLTYNNFMEGDSFFCVPFFRLGGLIMYSVLDIAKYIIYYCKQQGYYISNLKLQKILYFVQAEFLVELHVPCFYEEIEAWDFGPVVPEVYHKYKHFGSSNIIDHTFRRVNISRRDRELVEDIVNECSNYSASQLVEFTHNQRPWMDAYQKYCNNIISKESIREYFEE